jgi:large subunit ribosomal protein L25
MFKLKAETRDLSVRGKRLRREGSIPCVLYGKHMEASESIQISRADSENFIKNHTIGSKLELQIGKKKQMVLLKNVSLVPVTNSVEHLGFLALTAGEKISSSVHILLMHKEKVDGIIQQSTSEITYTALPEDLIEVIEIDLTDGKPGDVIKVSDLPIAKNKKLEIHTPLEDVVVSITPHREVVEESETEESPVAQAVAEVPVVKEKKNKED